MNDSRRFDDEAARRDASRTLLPGVQLIVPEVHYDERGFFKEFAHGRRDSEAFLGSLRFVQTNVSQSRGGVLRGLHFQRRRPQGKLITALQGVILDVVADVRPESPTFGRYMTHVLSAENHHQLWVPPGYAHGFYVLSDQAQVLYQCTEYYDPTDEAGIVWHCPLLAIDWPVATPVVSAKDAQWPDLMSYVQNQGQADHKPLGDKSCDPAQGAHNQRADNQRAHNQGGN